MDIKRSLQYEYEIFRNLFAVQRNFGTKIISSILFSSYAVIQAYSANDERAVSNTSDNENGKQTKYH